MSPLTFDFIAARINANINDRAAHAQREIQAMAESARRSLAQRLRVDRTEPYLTLRARMEKLK